ncbi:MAG: redoxin domain-containing protein [Alphaproteobacteria bacterium]|nr:redoxin domain-containing protein [Alphaproteobacteria bacterium]
MKLLPLGILLAICALLAFGMMRKNDAPPDSPLIGKAFPALALEGRSLQELSARQVTIINIFASWCAPCALEQPTLLRFKEKNIAPTIGIAWKNKPGDVAQWLQEHGNPYTHLLHDEKGDITVPLSLTGVPETFIIDKGGVVRYHTSQPITDEHMAQEIIPLVERLQQ